MNKLREKNQSLFWLHLEGPSNSSKKLKRVSVFPKKFTRYQSAVRTTNKKNFVLLMKQRSSRKFFLLCFFFLLFLFLFILPATYIHVEPK